MSESIAPQTTGCRDGPSAIDGGTGVWAQEQERFPTADRAGLSRLFEPLERAINRLFAGALLLVSLPVFAPIALAIVVTSGFPVLYKGVRLGRHKKPFQMYKFRTLVNGAEDLIGGRLLSHRDADLRTPIGSFLRDTKLDELPQLLNILKGDMNFVGPRPERPQVYKEICRDLPAYACRFAVKPGLIGHSQVFTPHNTPKRIRSFIDNRMVSRRPHPFWDLFLIFYIALIVATASARRLVRYAARDMILRGVLRGARERRYLARTSLNRAAVMVALDGNGTRCHAPLVNINDSSFVMVCGEALDTLPEQFELIIRVGRNGRTRRLTAPCSGSVSQIRPNSRGVEYIVDFEPTSDRSLYIVHQHFLKHSLADLPAR